MKLDVYQEIIHKTRYAKFLDDKGRREHWDETVDRYVSFMKNHVKKQQNVDVKDEIWQKIRNAIVNLEVVPSMRALMSAGKALEKNSSAGYNCAFLPIDDPKAFDEALNLLMGGSGVGFSCERQYINKMPEIPDVLYESDTTIIVKDSKAGWSKALRQLIALLYTGEVPNYDLLLLRPAGARLKTTGGRSSGPGPLDELFKFVIKTFKNAKGRKLNSIECHDIMCKTGEVVVMGGSRRSALISLSNLSDDRMRNAKSGAWWEQNSQRALANNSAVYTEKPDIGLFMKEWLSLYESKSGERGIVNREAMQKIAARNGRRDPNHAFSTNPCFSGNTLVAVADGRNAVSIKQLAEENTKFKVYSARSKNNGPGWKTEIKEAIAFKTGTRKVLKVVLSNGNFFECTPEHRLAMASGDYIEAKDSLNIDLARFYTTNEKYRTINSYSSGFARQYRMMWEYENGPLPSGYHIDHINNDHGDYIENLAILKEEDHNRKSAIEHQGLNNSVFKIRDVQNWKNNHSRNSFMESNPAYSGISDEEIISDAYRLIDDNIKITINNLRKLNSNIPKAFSKNRFGGNIKNLRDICVGIVNYNKPKFDKEVKTAVEQKDRNFSNSIKVVSIIDEDKIEDVYDLTVDDNHNFYIINSGNENYDISEGVLVHNCSEIILREHGLCNLSEVIIRDTDTLEILKNKVEIATIIGTFQSTLTYFPYLRKIWTKNNEEERLLGVSMTGIYDNKLLNDYTDKKLPARLSELRQLAIDTNKYWAEFLGIPQSAAITAVKPSGTVSELTGTASGIHPRHDKYYYRRIRNNKMDPVTKFLIESGVEHEDDVMNSSSVVFTFPKKAPSGAKLKSDISAVDHLELWLKYQESWCEHKPSVTVSVKEEEWLEVGAWCYKNFDQLSGVSFLPYDGGTYRQAPYESVDETKYDELLAKTPKTIDWEKLKEYDDLTTGSQELACVSGGCEI